MASSPEDQSTRPRGGCLRFGYNENTDTEKDTRNVHLIVGALIITVTFQAGVNPYGGVWQEQDEAKGYKAGRAIYSCHEGPFYAFLISNTFAFSASSLVIISLTYRFPFYMELCAAISAMFATYAAAIAIAPDESVKFQYLLLTAVGPFVVRMVLEIYKWWKRKRT